MDRGIMKTRSLPLAVLALAASTAVNAQSLPPKAQVERLVDSLGADFVATRGAPAVSIAVVRGHDTLAYGGWGKADYENDVAATARTVYRIGSITKQFTAAAVMKFVEQETVRLDDSIGTYLPALPAAWRVATVRQLLNHTSGIPSYTDIGERWTRRWGEEMTPDTLVALTAKDPMWFPPGSSWRYDNSGYVVLGMLIEKMAGRPWATDIQERFAKPLGLADTRNCAMRTIIMRRAHGYELTSNGLFANAAYLAMSQPYAAGALCSTVGDLAKWNDALANGQVVSPASYALMTTPQGAAATAPLKYGFGLARDTMAGRVVIVHGGGINGFISSNAWFPDVQTSVTVLTNSGSARADALLAQVARAAMGVPLVKPLTRVAITAEARALYVGVYAMRLGAATADFTITDRAGEVYGQLAGQPANQLIPLGNHVFGVSFDPTLRITFTVENGKATKLTLMQNGQTAEGMRKP
jgi:D-alanyl-D-alanine carboxypeptidase